MKGEKGKVYFNEQKDNQTIELTAKPTNATSEEQVKLVTFIEKIAKNQ